MRAGTIGVAAFLLAGLWPCLGFAACTPPVPPPAEAKPAKPKLPDKPACLAAKDGCPGWEAYSYNDAIKVYNAQAQVFRPLAEAYVQKLNAYVKASGEYVQCEVKSLQQ